MPLQINVGVPVRTSDGVTTLTGVFIEINIKTVKGRTVGGLLTPYKSKTTYGVEGDSTPVELLTIEDPEGDKTFQSQASTTLTKAQYNAPIDLLTALHNACKTMVENYAGVGNVSIVGY